MAYLWNATVRRLDPWGFAGSVVTHPLPFALLATIVSPPTGAPVLLLALAARFTLALRIDTLVGRQTAPLWWLPGRDLLGFALFVATFFVRSIDWRGSRLRLAPQGRIAATKESVR